MLSSGAKCPALTFLAKPQPVRASGGGEQRVPPFAKLRCLEEAPDPRMATNPDPAAAFNAANHAVKMDRFMVAAGGEPNTASKPVKVKVSAHGVAPQTCDQTC